MCICGPLFDSYYVNMNTMGERSSIGGITFVDHPEHPSLYNFSSKNMLPKQF